MNEHIHAVSVVAFPENPTATWREAEAGTHHDLVKRPLIDVELPPEVSSLDERLQLHHLCVATMPARLAQ